MGMEQVYEAENEKVRLGRGRAGVREGGRRSKISLEVESSKAWKKLQRKQVQWDTVSSLHLQSRNFRHVKGRVFDKSTISTSTTARSTPCDCAYT